MTVALEGPYGFDPSRARWALRRALRRGADDAGSLYLLRASGQLEAILVELEPTASRLNAPPVVEELLEALVEAVWWEHVDVGRTLDGAWHPLILLAWPDDTVTVVHATLQQDGRRHRGAWFVVDPQQFRLHDDLWPGRDDRLRRTQHVDGEPIVVGHRTLRPISGWPRSDGRRHPYSPDRIEVGALPIRHLQPVWRRQALLAAATILIPALLALPLL